MKGEHERSLKERGVNVFILGSAVLLLSLMLAIACGEQQGTWNNVHPLIEQTAL